MLPEVKIDKKNFHKLDLSQLPTPCYVIDLNIVKQNLQLLRKIKEQTSVNILLALKAFSLKKIGPMISDYLDGTSASGLNEAKLAKKYFHGLVSTFAPAFKESEIEEIVKLSNHLIFNSLNQLEKFSVKAQSEDVDIGVRINPIYSEVKEKKYNPAGFDSRLGIHYDKLKDIDFKNIDGIHFHSLCEQNFSTLKNTWDVIYPEIKTYFKFLKWINLGGGHHITRNDYDVNELINFLNEIKVRTKCKIFIEPGEAIFFQSGILVGEILDVLKSKDSKIPNIAITDISPTCHMPDVIEAPYRPKLMNEAINNNGINVLIGGPSCLAGDNIGSYNFISLPKIGEKIVFLDQAHYTIVKTNFFNGISHPSIFFWDSKKNELELVKNYTFKDYEMRL